MLTVLPPCGLGSSQSPAHPIPFLHLLSWRAPPTCHPAPPSSPELSIFPNGPSRPLKHSLPPNRSPWQTRNLKVILLCDQTAGCTSSAPLGEAPARPLWGVGGGGGSGSKREGSKETPVFGKSPPPPPPAPRPEACRPAQGWWAHPQQGHPQLPVKSRPGVGGGPGSTLAGPSCAPSTFSPAFSVCTHPSAPRVLQAACGPTRGSSPFTGSEP